MGFYLLDYKQTIRTDTPEDWLGRVVISHDRPEYQYAPYDASNVRGDEWKSDSGLTNLSAFVESKRGMKIYTNLVDLFKGSFDRNASTSPSIKATSAIKYYVDRHDEVFERLQGTHEWKEKVIKLKWKDNSAFLITGVLVSGELDITETSSSVSSFNVEGKLPLEKIGQAFAVPLPDIPVQGGLNKNRENNQQGHMDLLGKRIFAIEYRILRKRRLHDGQQLTDKRKTGERWFGDGEDAEQQDVFEIVLENTLLEDEIDDEENIL